MLGEPLTYFDFENIDRELYEGLQKLLEFDITGADIYFTYFYKFLINFFTFHFTKNINLKLIY